MTTPDWQIQNPFSAIIFDVDGTLSTLEGIDYLAEMNGVGDQVKALTAEAMGKTGINPQLYQQRLDLVRPRQDQVLTLGQEYFRHRVQDSMEVVNILRRLQKSVYLLTAGLYQAVSLFADKLGIPVTNIYAVNIQFDQQGNYRDFDHSSPLTTTNGKRIIAEQLKHRHSTILHIGDGLNDLSSHDIVSRFVGYGGVFFRENIAAQCEYYIKTLSLSALLPLALTPTEVNQLTLEEQMLYQKGLKSINVGEVKL